MKWQQYEDILFNHFCNDFISNTAVYKGKKVRLNNGQPINGRHSGFWHIISNGSGPEDLRNIRPERCQRILWPRAMINHCGSNDVLSWEETHRGKLRALITLPDFSYLTVLDLRSGGAFLVTAYDLERSHQRVKLEKQMKNSAK
ncbi:hypothetical protein Pr1d_24130 [Bythopirellula goksoeyrii]|uniref:Uncharacterized protein n=1 Tax=Bythopirellula goksoeyrii TaxID=1400387 RepID=A0A5B9QC73_9BACT|nr:hypothetical protein Pr1d_24130 [Bythopirellula goksoeyrii]